MFSILAQLLRCIGDSDSSQFSDHSPHELLQTISQSLQATAAGIIWPAHAKDAIHWRYDAENLPPADANDWWQQLPNVDLSPSSFSNTFLQPGAERTRLVASLPIPQRAAGWLWVESDPQRQWSALDQEMLLFSAKILAASTWLARQLGSPADQRQLIRCLRESAVIIGRMAHDFDNILTGVNGFTELTLPLLPPLSLQHQYLTEVSKVGQRGIQFTQQLHHLSRSGQVRPQLTALAPVLAKAEVRQRELASRSLHLDFQIANELPPVAMETQPLTLVFDYLIDNAREACRPSGSVTVRTAVRELSEREAFSKWGNVRSGEHVVVAIQDNGSGIKPEVQRRLFAELFVTTKPRHRGLGLAIVYRTLYVHGGGMTIASQVDVGTKVEVYLPLCPPPEGNSE